MEIIIGSNEAGQRLDKFLRKLLKDVPLSAIFKALRKGDVRVNGKKQKEKYILQEEDLVTIKYITSKKEDKFSKFINVDSSGIKIAYEDENLLVIEKWPGILVHPDSNNNEPTLTDYALSYLNAKGDYKPESELTFTPASCNRLDRNTSGLVIFGKNFEALRSLNELIRNGDVDKYYNTIVQGRVKDGLYNGYILKNEENNISRVYDTKVPNSKEISMEIKTIQSNGAFSFIEIKLLTGRSHQIRAHMAHLGNPLIGDMKYGKKDINSYFKNKYGLEYQFLYAYKLIIRNATGKLAYLNNKTIVEALPPIFKKIKQDVFKVNL